MQLASVGPRADDAETKSLFHLLIYFRNQHLNSVQIVKENGTKQGKIDVGILFYSVGSKHRT